MKDAVLEQIGPRLRAARLKQELTLEELAARAGMSGSTLSRLESGKRQASLEILLPLTRELRITLDDLIPAEAPDPRVTPVQTTRHGVRMVRLSPPSSPTRTYRMTFPARKAMPAQRTHEGHDWVYVLAGRLRLQLGEQDLVLAPGEAAEFDTRVPHAMGSADGKAVEVLSIFGADGERIHTLTHDGGV
jgi:transcriptional regulator with XRE-family HTH domain